MGMVCNYLKMEINIQAILKTIKWKAKEFIYFKMEINILEILSIIYRMELENSYFLTEKLMKGILKMVKVKMIMENTPL